MRRPISTCALNRRSIAGITLALLFSSCAFAHAQEKRSTPTGPPPVPETATEPQGLIAEPAPLERAIIFMDRHFASGDTSNGFYVDFANMIPGAGWISGGPGYRRWFARDHILVDSSAAISWRGYKTAQARFELPRLVRSRFSIGSQFKWQDYTQVAYFGEGPDAPESNEGEYHLKSQNLVGYLTFRPVEWLGLGGKIGWLDPSIVDSVFGAPEQPTFMHGEASVTADTRDFPEHPTRGGVLRAAASNFADRDVGTFSFNRYEAEATHFLPLAGSRIVIGARGWLVASDAAEGRSVPFYLQPSLGGHNSLRGYADYRFHDRNMLVLTIEARTAMMTHVDAAFFVDAGNVAGRVKDLNLDKRSYGGGLRLHSRRQTFARFDVARGGEGWRLVFRLTDPLNLARLARRTAPVPFVP